LILNQLCWTQQVTLLKSGTDTIVILPLNAIKNINVQLIEARIIKKKNIKLVNDYKKQGIIINKYKYELAKKDSIIAYNTKQINHQSLVIDKNVLLLKKTDYQLLKYIGMYDRSKKKNTDLKRVLVGGGILSVGIITLILVSTL